MTNTTNTTDGKASETISSVSDKATVRKTLAIRSAARARLGLETDKCPTCGRSETLGYSRHNGHVIVEGCVDACHVPHETGISNRSTWLHSQNARRARQMMLAGLV